MRKIVCALALLAAAPRVRAEEMLRPDQIPEKARQLAERGRHYHEAGDYEHAIAAFKEAYVLAPSPGLLFNLAQAYRLAGECDDAAWMYRRYLDSNPSADRRTIAENHLAVVEKCGHGTFKIAAAQIAPPVTEAKLAPAAAGAQLAIVSAPAPSAPSTKALLEERAGLTLAVAGGVALAGASWFALDAHDASNTVSNLYQKGAKGDQVAPIATRGAHSAEYAQWLGIGGGLAVASGAALYFLGRRTEKLERLAVAPSANGATVGMSWRW